MDSPLPPNDVTIQLFRGVWVVFCPLFITRSSCSAKWVLVRVYFGNVIIVVSVILMGPPYIFIYYLGAFLFRLPVYDANTYAEKEDGYRR